MPEPFLADEIIGLMPSSIAAARIRCLFDVRAGAIIFIARTTLLLWVSDLLIVLPLVALRFFLDDTETFDTSAYSLVDILVVAPLLENICFIGLIEFMRIFEPKNRTIVVCIAALSAVAHLIAGGIRAISGAIGFAILSASYLLWKDSTFTKRYAITVMQHVLMNVPAAFLLLTVE